VVELECVVRNIEADIGLEVKKTRRTVDREWRMKTLELELELVGRRKWGKEVEMKLNEEEEISILREIRGTVIQSPGRVSECWGRWCKRWETETFYESGDGGTLR